MLTHNLLRPLGPTMRMGGAFLSGHCGGTGQGRAGVGTAQPVRLGDGEHIALAQEGEALGELRPLRGAWQA